MCQACGKELPPSRGLKPRKWCSDRCRVWLLRHPGQARSGERMCEICGTDIGGLQYKAVVCSAKCRNMKDDRAMRERNLAITRTCAFCGGEFHCVSPVTRCCSVSCAQKHRHATVDPEVARARKEVSRALRLERIRRKNRKRRSKDRQREPYAVAEIAARDRYRCNLCRRKVNMRLPGSHPRGPTIDHIVPISLDGDDTRANVALAHRICNVRKNVQAMGEQLALIG